MDYAIESYNLPGRWEGMKGEERRERRKGLGSGKGRRRGGREIILVEFRSQRPYGGAAAPPLHQE